MSVADDIKARLDIADVVSEYVPLKKAGRSLKAVCPFHNEKTPSFIVNPERQSWRCFGACATGGDVFSFVMRKEGVEFGEALRLLADKAGVVLSNRSAAQSDRNEILYSVNRLAAQYFQEVLASPQGRQASEYMARRGLDAVTSERFELGLSPEGWDGLKSHLSTLGVPEDQAVEAGVVYRNDEGRTWDFFRGRLMFPIHDRQGRVAGFGGRALDDSNPKYINTSQTPVFDKRSTLYALHLATASIRNKSAAVVVEGYMDAIAAHQHGFTNVVASMGTALTEDQVTRLKGMASSFVLALDADAAGQEATLRSLEASWRVIGHQVAAARHSSLGVLYQRETVDLKIAALPEGRDPDDIIREDAAEWERLTEQAVPLMDYLIPAIAARFDVRSGQGKSQVVEAVFPLIAATENPFDQERYFGALAKAIDVDQETLKGIIAQRKPARPGGARRRTAAEAAPVPTILGDPESTLDEYTMALLLHRPELKARVQEFSPENFRKSEVREVFTRWLACPTMDALWDTLDESLRPLAAELSERELAPIDRGESEAAIDQCLQRLERRHLQELQEALLSSEDVAVPPPRELEGEISSVNTRLKELFSQPAR